MAQVKDFIFEEIGTFVRKLSSLKEKELCNLDFEYVSCEYKTSNEPPKTGWKKYEKGERLSGTDDHYWLHITFDEVAPQQYKELIFTLKTGLYGKWDGGNPQGMIFIDGKLVQALDVNHTWYPLEFNKKYDIYIYFYIGRGYRCFDVQPCLLLRDTPVYNLYYDLSVPYETMKLLDSEDYNFIQIKNALNKTLFKLDLRNAFSEEFYKSIEEASKYMRAEFYNQPRTENDPTVTCVGHTHIDIAWTWTVQQTREKAERSFATALSLMERYPEYTFMSSQPQLYQFVKEANPEMYERIKERVREGRWEVEGAMWLEADCNLISGESMVRQILHGKRFMKEEFGVESHMLWLPDVFGYSVALPQILQKSGIDKFFTTKIAWNESNKMPHDTFIWRGIDGTEIFSSFRREYVLDYNPKIVYDTWDEYKDKNILNETLITMGWGDGGGGTTAEMIEQNRRIEMGIPGLPASQFKTAEQFFDDIEEKFNKNTEELRITPKWDGELYLEMHRGTYTTIGKNKKNNRKSEFLYQQAETLSVYDMAIFGGNYDSETMYKNQMNILLNQFHDIIPGSSIKEVYDVTDVEYERILREGREIVDEKLEALKNNIKTDGGLLVYNSTPFEQSGTVVSDGKRYIAESIPPHGYKVINTPIEESGITVTEKAIENEVIRVVFDDNYEIASIFDKEQNREVIAKGQTANRLEVYEDYPYCYDAWEISNYYNQKMWRFDAVDKIELLENGIRIYRSYSHSKLTQDVIISSNSKRIDFVTEVDWHEDHVLLKTAFPVDIHSSRATYDIQFGNIERPTHYNTSWDAAKFEVCGHKWADLSEGGYGVSLMNDCKYGYGIHENVMTLSLLKAPTSPNPVADRGMHTFTYSLYPHAGDFAEGKTVQEAYLLNVPLEVMQIEKSNGNMPEAYSIASVNADNVALETIKKAEDDDSVIIRMFEFENRKSEVEVEINFNFKEIYFCDLMENNLEKAEVNGNKIKFRISNYEIVTIKAVR